MRYTVLCWQALVHSLESMKCGAKCWGQNCLLEYVAKQTMEQLSRWAAAAISCSVPHCPDSCIDRTCWVWLSASLCPPANNDLIGASLPLPALPCSWWRRVAVCRALFDFWSQHLTKLWGDSFRHQLYCLCAQKVLLLTLWRCANSIQNAELNR